MILTCPDCATRYLTTAEDIGPKGRTVRCSSCQASWFVKAEPDILNLSVQDRPLPNKSPTPQPATRASHLGAEAGLQAAAHIRDKTYRKRVARRMMSVGLIWALTLAILGAGLGAAYYLRQPIVEKYPAAATIYKGFGVHVTQNGLSLDNMSVKSAYVEGVSTVLVAGELRNIDRVSRLAGPIYFDMLDVAGQSLAGWVYDFEGEAFETEPIKAGVAANFVTQYANPPIDAVRLRYGLLPYSGPGSAAFENISLVTSQDEGADDNGVTIDGAELGISPLAPLSGQH